MANKIAQITIGDALYIQLDDNPKSTGFDAPLGSLAYWQDIVNGLGKVYVKITTDSFGWNDMSFNWETTGNLLTEEGLMGSLNDFDVSLVRNNVKLISLVPDTDSGYQSEKINFFNGFLKLKHHTANDGAFMNNAIFSTLDGTYPIVQRSAKNISIYSHGLFVGNTRNGYYSSQKPFDPATPPNQNVERSTTITTAGEKNRLFTGVALTYDLLSMVVGNYPSLFMAEIILAVRDKVTGLVSQRKKTVTFKITNETTKQYSTIFEQDDYTFFEVGASIPNFTISFSNDNDWGVLYPLNTAKPTINVTGLTVGHGYDVMVQMERKAMSLL